MIPVFFGYNDMYGEMFYLTRLSVAKVTCRPQ
jgi:hypothetical protein